MELQALGVALSATDITNIQYESQRCQDLLDTCVTGGYEQLFTCYSYGTVLTVKLAKNVAIPALTTIDFQVQGYNSRYAASDWRSEWKFITRDSDSERTKLDEKPNITGIDLKGIIHVPAIRPTDTKVEVVDNQV